MDMIGKAHMTRVEGTFLAWGEMGAGEPLVLLHGMWDSHRTWRRVAPLLAERFRVLMPDLPGHGWSGRPDAPYTLTWYARTLLGWMDAISLGRAHLCGHSYGGGVAQWMLLEDRARVNRLALVASGGLGREVGIGLRLATFPVLGPILTPLVMRLGAPAMMRLASAAFGHMEPEEIARHVRMNRLPGSCRAFRRTVGGVINLTGQYMQTWQRIDEVDSLPPVAAFWGDADPILPLGHGLAARDRIAEATLSIYPRCGHYLQLDAPVRFAQELTEFLSDPRRPCARLAPPSVENGPRSRTRRGKRPRWTRTRERARAAGYG